MYMPCPFCGATNHSTVIAANDYKRVRVECGECGATGPEVRRKYMLPSVSISDCDAAQVEWNNRKGAAPVAPAAPDLRAELLMFAGRMATEKYPLTFCADRVIPSSRIIDIVDDYLACGWRSKEIGT